MPTTTTTTAKQKAAMLDEFGELSRKLATYAPEIARHEALRKTITGWYTNKPGEQAFSMEGRLYEVQISPRRLERRVANMPVLFRILGKLQFLKLAKVSLADIEANTTEAEQQEFLASDYTGGRTLKAVLKAEPAPAIKNVAA